MFISRLVRGGLAESTGLLGVNDEILEVNGIDVAGKSLDQVSPHGTKGDLWVCRNLKARKCCAVCPWCQVTDMLVANSHNLIVTVKPADQKNNVVPRGNRTTSSPNGQKNRLPARY